MKDLLTVLKEFDDIRINYSYPGCKLNFTNTKLPRISPNQTSGFITHLLAKDPEHEYLPLMRQLESVRGKLKQLKQYTLKYKI